MKIFEEKNGAMNVFSQLTVRQTALGKLMRPDERWKTQVASYADGIEHNTS